VVDPHVVVVVGLTDASGRPCHSRVTVVLGLVVTLVVVGGSV